MWALLLASLSFGLSYALIEETSMSIKGPDIFLLDAFSFSEGGHYTFTITANVPTQTPALLLFIADEGDDCDTIGRTCSYSLLKMDNICATARASELSDLVIQAYPVPLPTEKYVSWDGSSSLDFESMGWNYYRASTYNTVRDYLSDLLLPAVQKYLHISVLDSENATSDSQRVKTITTEITDDVSVSGKVYFAIISCGTEEIKYGATGSIL